MLDMIRNSIKDTPEAAALFYDELARIVQLGGIDPKIEVHSNFPQHSVPVNNWNCTEKQPTFRYATRHWFSLEMIFEEGAHKFHTDDASLPRSG